MKWHLREPDCTERKHAYGGKAGVYGDHPLKQGLDPKKADWVKRCPHCGTYQVRYWGERTEAWRVMWGKEESR